MTATLTIAPGKFAGMVTETLAKRAIGSQVYRRWTAEALGAVLEPHLDHLVLRTWFGAVITDHGLSAQVTFDDEQLANTDLVDSAMVCLVRLAALKGWMKVSHSGDPALCQSFERRAGNYLKDDPSLYRPGAVTWLKIAPFWNNPLFTANVLKQKVIVLTSEIPVPLSPVDQERNANFMERVRQRQNPAPALTA